MHESLILFFVELFNKEQSKGHDGFILLKSGIFLNVFIALYDKLILVDVMPIDSIPQEEKIKYWNIAKGYYQDKETAVKASKAAYLISLLTQKEEC